MTGQGVCPGGVVVMGDKDPGLSYTEQEGFPEVKPPFILGKEKLGVPQGRKRSLQEGHITFKSPVSQSGPGSDTK